MNSGRKAEKHNATESDSVPKPDIEVSEDRLRAADLYNEALQARLEGHLDDAIYKLQHACDLEPNNANFFYQLALSQEVASRLDLSLDALTRAVSLDGMHPEYRYQRSIILERLGQIQACIPDCEVACSLRPEPDWVIRLATLYSKEQKIRTSLHVLARFCALNLKNKEVWTHFLNLCNANVDTASEILIKICDGIVLPPDLSVAVSNFFLRGGDFTTAERPLSRSLLFYPEQAVLHYSLGELMRHVGDNVKARESFSLAVTLAPDNHRYAHHLANCLHDLRSFDEAFSFHKVAVASFEDEPAYFIQMAKTMIELGLKAESITVLRSVTERFPDRNDAHTMLGHVHFGEKNYRDAFSSYESAFAMVGSSAIHNVLDYVVAGLASGNVLAGSKAIVEHYKTDVDLDLRFASDMKAIEDPLHVMIKLSPGQMTASFSPVIYGIDPEWIKFLVTRFFETCPLFFSLAKANPAIDVVSRFDAGDIGCPRIDSKTDMAFCSSDASSVLIPDHVFIRTNAYQKYAEQIAERSSAWHLRRPVAYWRGTSTGQWQGEKYSSDGKPLLDNLPRLKLCKIGNLAPDVIDAKIAQIVQIEENDLKDAIQACGLLSPFVDADVFVDYQIQIDIDGNSNSWSGFFQKLLTGSPVVKVASPGGYKQWFYDRLIPWENFVPIKEDMSDLVDIVRSLLSDPTKAQAIGAAGQALARSMSLESEFEKVADRLRAASQ